MPAQLIPAPQELSEEAASLAADIPRAIAAGELALFLQPKYDIRRSAVCGVEALVRWRHPIRGLLSPDAFIAAAEATGHIGALTDCVIDQALSHQRALLRGGQALEMTVNLSARLAASSAFVEQAIEGLARAEGKLTFEVAEGPLIAEKDAGLAGLARLREAGHGVAIDDFGAGVSSFPWLKALAADELKIDRSLVLTLADSRRDTLVVRSVIELAHGLGLQVTAEGVETNEAFALLAGMGCDFAQGFLIERPMPVDAVIAFLREQRATGRRYG